MSKFGVVLFELCLISIYYGTALGRSWKQNNAIHGPEQIHIAYGDTPQFMTVIWSTDNSTVNATSVVKYGQDAASLNQAVTPQNAFLKEGNPKGLQNIHRAVMKDLKPGTKYYYKVCVGNQSSAVYNFVTMRIDKDFAPRLLMFGDMGRHGGAPSLRSLIKETMTGLYTAVFHVGDFAYDLDSEGGVNGDEFMKRIVPIATTLPYMTCPGNHEIAHNFSHYRYRFSMPNLPWPTPLGKMWYSFNMGKAHFISYSTEVYFTYDQKYVDAQLEWLINDLTEANRKENRTQRPWIIALGHRPMYCSNIDHDDCTKPHPILRASLEVLFMKYGVDLIFEAHEHSYERLWPVYQQRVYQYNYNSPKAPVHIVAGAAGCNESDGFCLNPMLGPRGPWSAYRAWLPGEYGYGRLHITNETHLHWQQVYSTTGDIEDEIWIVQENHGPFQPITSHNNVVN